MLDKLTELVDGRFADVVGLSGTLLRVLAEHEALLEVVHDVSVSD